MTKKQKLINWGKQKFNEDNGGAIVLLYYELEKTDDDYERPYLDLNIKFCGSIEKFLQFIDYYNEELIEWEYVKPTPECYEYEEDYKNDLTDYEDMEEDLRWTYILPSDVCIIDALWKSSEDIKHFEEN